MNDTGDGITPTLLQVTVKVQDETIARIWEAVAELRRRTSARAQEANRCRLSGAENGRLQCVAEADAYAKAADMIEAALVPSAEATRAAEQGDVPQEGSVERS